MDLIVIVRVMEAVAVEEEEEEEVAAWAPFCGHLIGAKFNLCNFKKTFIKNTRPLRI
jgi:hypothetical protein